MQKIQTKVTESAQLAALLEVSGYPKPGNVHRTRDFSDVRFEHFLAGSVTIGRTIREASEKGVKISEGTTTCFEDINLGDMIKRGVKNVQSSHKGGNTHLGMILLFTPLAVASGKMFAGKGNFEITTLRKNFEQIIKGTTKEDSLNVYEAIHLTLDLATEKEKQNQNSWLGKPDTTELSVTNPDTKEKLSKNNINLYDWMKISSKWDGIAKELTNNLETTIQTGYPTFKKTIENEKDINTAIVHTFLKILAKNPDTFIARKQGLEKTNNIEKAVGKGMKKAKELSKKAEKLLKNGGLTTKKGRKEIKKLDEKLQKSGGRLNPGTTADLTATSINIALLSGIEY